MVPGSQSAQRNEVRVCPACGAVAPVGLAQCGACGEALGLRGVPCACALPGRPWARVEVTLPCPRCSAPVNPRPDAVDGVITCGRCGESSAVEPAVWDEVVHFAHAAVDLAHPDFYGQNAPLGEWNPFAALGLRTSCETLPSERVSPQSRLSLRLGPGAPLCGRCHTALSIHFLHNGRQSTECPSCGDREAFALPPGLAARTPALRALVSFSPHAATAAGRVEPWWLLIDGPSAMRSLVVAQRAESERAESERAQWEAWQLQERERLEREAQLEAASAKRAQEERDRQAREARAATDIARMSQELRALRGQFESSERALAEARMQLQQAQTQVESERQTAEARVAQERQITERTRQEGAYYLEQARGEHAQREGGWRAHEAKLREESAAQEKRHKTRWRVAIALWVLFFLVVAADLALAFAR
jgi:hypothetical protein